MALDLGFRDPKIHFGLEGNDIALEFVLKMSWKTDDFAQKEILFDELRMITEVDLTADNDVLFPTIKNLKLDLGGKYGQKSEPARTTLDMSKGDYEEFIHSVEKSLFSVKNWLNDPIMMNGIIFPWTIEEFKTSVMFKKG